MEKQDLGIDKAKRLVDRLGPSYGYDFTYEPRYPKTRNDVCAVRRLAEDGSTFGYDTIYLIWKDKSGEVRHDKLVDSSSTKDYLHIEDVVEKNEEIQVTVRTGGSYGGKPWTKDYIRNKKDLDLD